MPTTDRRRAQNGRAQNGGAQSGGAQSGGAQSGGAQSGGAQNGGAQNGRALNGRGQNGGGQNGANGSKGADPSPIIPILARRVREVESKAGGGKVGPTNRTKFQVIALLVREQRSWIRANTELTMAVRTELLKRLDGVATILARTAARDTSLIAMLDEKATPGPAAQRMRRDWLLESGAELAPEELVIEAPTVRKAPSVSAELAAKQVVPASVPARAMANPFLAPDLERRSTDAEPSGVLTGWNLMDPLYRAFEEGAGGLAASMELPEVPEFDRFSPPGLHVMRHQAQLLEKVRQGHRSFLLADEPGLGKTAQALIAASVAGAYPILCVVPNVVKINWAREVQRWTPQRRVTIIHGDGAGVDAFADVFIINYAVLDRHLSWLGSMGFRGMVVDEAHFIKNLSSQRSQHVLTLSERIRDLAPGGDPLLMALTGTPLINDVEDFHAIWRFLGWVNEKKPTAELIHKLEAIGRTPAERGFYPEARKAVISMGIVRRKKVDVATDLPDKRVVDLPVELEGEVGRSIRAAERDLTKRLVTQYRRMVEASKGDIYGPPDEALMRRVALGELEASSPGERGENVFSMVRRIGQGKATLAADYAGQLARSVGKVVFFAKHIDVMDKAEEMLRDNGIKTVSIRGDQSPAQRQVSIDAFQKDPTVSVIVCSLTAAGVGVNLHAASNVVLAELSWTAAEQQQAIDRVHRIGQDEPVTAWRILAAGTIDSRIAELIDAKQGLAARALDGHDVEVGSGDSVQVDALVHLLRQGLQAEQRR